METLDSNKRKRAGSEREPSGNERGLPGSERKQAERIKKLIATLAAILGLTAHFGDHDKNNVQAGNLIESSSSTKINLQAGAETGAREEEAREKTQTEMSPLNKVLEKASFYLEKIKNKEEREKTEKIILGFTNAYRVTEERADNVMKIYNIKKTYKIDLSIQQRKEFFLYRIQFLIDKISENEKEFSLKKIYTAEEMKGLLKMAEKKFAMGIEEVHWMLEFGIRIL